VIHHVPRTLDEAAADLKATLTKAANAKSAFDWSSLRDQAQPYVDKAKGVWDAAPEEARRGLIGAGLGAGIGGAMGLANRKKRNPLESALTGAALGGIGGAATNIPNRLAELGSGGGGGPDASTAATQIQDWLGKSPGERWRSNKLRGLVAGSAPAPTPDMLEAVAKSGDPKHQALIDQVRGTTARGDFKQMLGSGVGQAGDVASDVGGAALEGGLGALASDGRFGASLAGGAAMHSLNTLRSQGDLANRFATSTEGEKLLKGNSALAAAMGRVTDAHSRGAFGTGFLGSARAGAQLAREGGEMQGVLGNFFGHQPNIAAPTRLGRAWPKFRIRNEMDSGTRGSLDKFMQEAGKHYKDQKVGPGRAGLIGAMALPWAGSLLGAGRNALVGEYHDPNAPYSYGGGDEAP